MPVAHLYRVVQDAAGNAIAGVQVTLCDPGTDNPIVDGIYADVNLTSPMSNPFTCMTGVIDVYLSRARTVRVNASYGSQTQMADYIDILPSAEMILAATSPIEVDNDAFPGAILQMIDNDTAEWVATPAAAGAVVEIVPGNDVTVDNTDPSRPVVGVTSGAAGGGNVTFKGAWQSIAYYLNDVVTYLNRLYICVLDVSATFISPDSDQAHWAEIAAIHDGNGRLQATDPAATGDLVTLNYFNTNAVRNPPPSDLITDLGSGSNRWRRVYTGAVVTPPTQSTPNGASVTVDATKGDALIPLGSTPITFSQIINPAVGQLLRITWVQGNSPVTFVWPSNCLFADGTGPQVLQPNYQLTVEFRWNGSFWIEISRSSVAHGIPIGGAAGQMLGKVSGTDYDAAWVPPPIAVPTGGIVLFGAVNAPSGWLLCNGQAVSRTSYSALFAVIGTTYGAGDGSTTFNVPNLSSRFPYGTTPGSTGGAASHTHSFSDGGHTHSSATHYHGLSGNGQARIHFGTSHIWMDSSSAGASWTSDTNSGWGGGNDLPNVGGNSNGAALGGTTDNATPGATGSGTANGTTGSASSLPPYLGVQYIIKI
jgi:microcystin-dependent protein